MALKQSFVLASLLLAGCATYPVEAETRAPSAEEAVPAESDINELFAEFDAAQLALSPTTKAYRGIRDEDYGAWDDFSDASNIAYQALLQKTVREMHERYDPAQLSPQDALSYRLFDAMAKRSARLFPYRNYGYIFEQMGGMQSELPAFLINIHSIENEAQARDYIARIAGIGPGLDIMTADARDRATAGVMPPKWVYKYVISDIQNLLDAGDESAVLEDFGQKVAALDIEDAAKAQLLAEARAAWGASARPAYERLLDEMIGQQEKAGTDDGIWRFDKGAEYYDALLANFTTTDLTADQIHNIGLREVARIHEQMSAIKDQVGFEGTLQDFFKFTREDPRFYPKSREEYLGKVEAHAVAMEAKLPDYFGLLPTDPLVVKPVEAFREKSAGKAFYQRPAPDGSRPGTYYVNLYDLDAMTLNELEALFYHEGLPGHHLQLSIQTALGDLPAFRRFGGVTAYTEGWGLYSEELGKDMGFYTDPYSDFGRLQMELLRAGRLVTDTGMHSKRWSREQAIEWFTQNTAMPLGDIRKQVERYVVFPGQATAYMIGKLKIMELREKARVELGDAFDIRAFHDTVLKDGPVPLSILEENVNAWIAHTKLMDDAVAQ